MAEEQVNTPQAEQNSETNPSTQADDKNDVPYGRFQEVNGQKNQFKSENESLKSENAKLKAVGNMSRVEMRKAFDNLSLDELEQLSKRINK